MSFRREIQWEPGVDGVQGLRIRWLLHGEKGVIQFVIATDWLPTEAVPSYWAGELRIERERRLDAHVYPYGADFGYHWTVPINEGELLVDDCDVLPGRCFYNGSGTRADHVLGLLFRDGHEAVWQQMAEEYERLAAIPEPIAWTAP